MKNDKIPVRLPDPAIKFEVEGEGANRGREGRGLGGEEEELSRRRDEGTGGGFAILLSLASIWGSG